MPIAFSFRLRPTMCHSPRLSRSAHSHLMVGSPCHRLGSRTTAGSGRIAPDEGGQHDHRPGLRNPCGRGPSLERAQVQLYRAWSYDHSTRLPCSARSTATGPIGIWQIPPLTIAFTFEVCGRHRGGGSRSSRTSAGRRWTGSADRGSGVAAVSAPCGSGVARSTAPAPDRAWSRAPPCTPLHGAGRGLMQGGICTFTPLHPLPRQSGRPDLNRGPHRPERCALPGCATPRGAEG